jgi:uncharacterized coiled-coil DUF342 family protein
MTRSLRDSADALNAEVNATLERLQAAHEERDRLLAFVEMVRDAARDAQLDATSDREWVSFVTGTAERCAAILKEMGR